MYLNFVKKKATQIRIGIWSREEMQKISYFLNVSSRSFDCSIQS